MGPAVGGSCSWLTAGPAGPGRPPERPASPGRGTKPAWPPAMFRRKCLPADHSVFRRGDWGCVFPGGRGSLLSAPASVHPAISLAPSAPPCLGAPVWGHLPDHHFLRGRRGLASLHSPGGTPSCVDAAPRAPLVTSLVKSPRPGTSRRGRPSCAAFPEPADDLPSRALPGLPRARPCRRRLRCAANQSTPGVLAATSRPGRRGTQPGLGAGGTGLSSSKAAGPGLSHAWPAMGDAEAAFRVQPAFR